MRFETEKNLKRDWAQLLPPSPEQDSHLQVVSATCCEEGQSSLLERWGLWALTDLASLTAHTTQQLPEGATVSREASVKPHIPATSVAFQGILGCSSSIRRCSLV